MRLRYISLEAAQLPHENGPMRMVVIVLVLAACGETRQVRRWPEHRRQEDERMLVLERKVEVLVKHVSALEQELQRLRAAPAEPAAPAESPPAPAAVPSPGP